MADPVTNNFGFTLPTVGGDIATWGGILNTGVISALDATLGNNISIPITSSDVSLTDAQMQNAIFVLSGALTGNRNLIFPLSNNSATVAVGGKFIIANNTTGAFNVTVITAATSSTGVIIPQGFAVEVYSDGTNVWYGNNGLGGFALASNGNPNGQLAGTAGSATTNASLAFDFTNGIFYVCTTTGNTSGAVWSAPQIIVPRGFDTPVNLGLAATHTGGNLLQLAIKQINGTSDPTVLSPVIVNFQTVSGGNTTGVPTSVSITGALSMTTFATGASMGSVNGVPFRIWYALFNNAGVAVPAMGVFSDASGPYQVSESGVASTVSMTGAAQTAGVWYTPNGTTLTNCAYRLIGYSEYTGGLVTAGTYSSDPVNTVLFGPGVRKPGDLVGYKLTTNPAYAQVANAYNPSATPPSLAAAALAVAAPAYKPSSPVNLLRVRGQAVLGSNAQASVTAFLYDGTNVVAVSAGTATTSALTTLPVLYQKVAGNVTPISFSIYFTNSQAGAGGDLGFVNAAASGGTAYFGTVSNTNILIEEIMG